MHRKLTSFLTDLTELLHLPEAGFKALCTVVTDAPEVRQAVVFGRAVELSCGSI